MWSRHKCHAAGSTPVLAGRVEVMGGGGEGGREEVGWVRGRKNWALSRCFVVVAVQCFVFVLLRGLVCNNWVRRNVTVELTDCSC